MHTAVGLICVRSLRLHFQISPLNYFAVAEHECMGGLGQEILIQLVRAEISAVPAAGFHVVVTFQRGGNLRVDF